MMKVENTQVQLRKGIIEFCILHIISRGEVYASDMLEELTQAKIVVVEGTLYPLLTRLRKANLVEYRWEESASGPPRKYFKLTDEGFDFLEKLNHTWEGLIDSTNKIIRNIKEEPITNEPVSNDEPIADDLLQEIDNPEIDLGIDDTKDKPDEPNK